MFRSAPTNGIKHRTQQERKYLDAFATGINAYAQEHAELIDDEVKVVLPVKAVDVLAHLQRVLNFTFVVSPDSIASLNDQGHSANVAPIQALGNRRQIFSTLSYLKF